MRRVPIVMLTLACVGCPATRAVEATPPAVEHDGPKAWLPAEAEVAVAAPAPIVLPGLRWVPDSATFIVGSRLDIVFASGAWNEFSPHPSESEANCGVTFEQLERMVIAGATDAKMATLVAPGIGRPEVLDCLHAKADGGGQGPMSLFSSSESSYLPVDENTVVLVHEDWEADVAALIAQAPPSRNPPALAAALSRTDMNRALWFVSTRPQISLPPQLAFLSDAQDILVHVDAHEGLGIEMELRFTDPGLMGEIPQKAEAAIREFASFATMLGLPSTVLDRMQFTTMGTLLRVTASVTPDELHAFAAKVRGVTQP